MIIRKLEVAGFRAFEQAEFEFQPGMNLLVGVNGVGKTTVLDVLRICLSRVLPIMTSAKSKFIKIEESDFKIHSESLKILCDFELNERVFRYLIHKQIEAEIIVDDEPGIVRYEKIATPDIEKIEPALPNLKESKIQPLGIYFSTRRSLPLDREPVSAEGGQAAAFSESLLESRGFNLREIAYWMRAQAQLAEELPRPAQHLGALHYAAKKFLPDCDNLHWVQDSKGVYLQIDKDGVPINVRQLSDGERGMLALALDLAKRLSQANPELDNPVKDGKAIVLIDELDLHLHPKWQRTIVDQLTSTFENCQFIATTHSPQIIPSVEPEQVLLIKDSEIIHPDRTLGMDTNWILQFIMDTDIRPEESQLAIKEVESLIREGRFREARETMAKFRDINRFDLPEWSIFEARMARMEILGDKK
jgi:predicted ATP-binding protein involved in virulence